MALGKNIIKRRGSDVGYEPTVGWVMHPNGASIVRGEIADTPEAKAASDALGVKQEAWERSLDPTRKNSNFLDQIGNSLGIKPISETFTANNLANLATNPMGMGANSLSNISGGSGNAGADLGLGNSLTGTSSEDMLNRAGAAGLVAGGVAAMPYLTGAGTTGTGATVGATEAAGGGGILSSIGDWANGVSKDTGGTGSVWQDLQNGVKGNGGAIVNGIGGIYNSYQQGQAANDIAQQQMNLQRPYYDAGTAALAKMQQGVSAYQQDPYNQWLQDQGNQGIQRSAAAKGMLGSGNVLAELAKYNQGMAGKGYQDWFGNQQTIAGYGSPAATAMGNSYATGRQGSADATSGALSSGANMLRNIWGNPNNGGTPNNSTTNDSTDAWNRYALSTGITAPSWQTPGINGNVNTNYNPNAYVNPNPTTDFSAYWPKSN